MDHDRPEQGNPPPTPGGGADNEPVASNPGERETSDNGVRGGTPPGSETQQNTGKTGERNGNNGG